MNTTYSFQEMKKGKIDVKTSNYDSNNQPKKATFKYEQEGGFCLGVARIENKNGMITGKWCLVSDYSGKRIVTIDAYKKEIQKKLQDLESLLHHRHNGLKKKADKA